VAVKFRTYNNDTRFGEDYYKLRRFLLELDDCNWHFGRWDWMITHGMLQEEAPSRIGIWEDGGKVVAFVAPDLTINGKCFFPYDKNYGFLHEDMIAHAKENLSKDGKVKILIRDGDMTFQETASKMGFLPTQSKDCDAIYPIGDVSEIRYELPAGFRVTSMRDDFDMFKYGQCLWKGFNHEANGEGPFVLNRDDLPKYEGSFLRPNVNLDIKIAVAAPNGDFVSYCGMWHDPASQSALVEPVATDPAYRKMGLGRAAVLEGVKRCGELGATRAFVDSSQQFYYRIGFRPYATSTFWEEKA